MSNAMTTGQPHEVAQQPRTLQGMLANINVKKRFEEILGQKAPAFISSIISAYQANKALQECDPQSIISAAAVAASLDLPINGSLGFAALVPYSGQAQFQIMARGFVQLAQRSGQYKSMSKSEIYDGQLVSWNAITGEALFDVAAKKSEKIVGYVFYFQLLNGFEKYTYMTVAEVEAHGKKYSKSYSNPKGKWQLDFQAMALKTVVKRGLSQWGPLSTEMQKAVEVDQSVLNESGQPSYIDATAEATAETTIVEPRRASAAPVMVHEKPPVAEANMAGAEPTPSGDLAVFIPQKVTKSPAGFRIYVNDTEFYVTTHEGYAAIAKAAATKNQPVELAWTEVAGVKTASNVTLAD